MAKPISRDEGNMQNGLNKGNIESLYKNMQGGWNFKYMQSTTLCRGGGTDKTVYNIIYKVYQIYKIQVLNMKKI